MDVALTAGFGSLVGAPRVEAIKAHGYSGIRNGDDRTQDADVFHLLMEEIIGAGLRPILGEITPVQVGLVPEGVKDIELRDLPDLDPSGLEPLLTKGTTPASYAAALNDVAPLVKAKGLRAWVGMTGTSPSDLTTLQAFLKLVDPIYGVSIHRYPPKFATTWEASYMSSREEEAAALKVVLRGRPFAVCEAGYSQGPQARWWQWLYAYHWHLSDAQLSDALAGERAYWEREGAAFLCIYQENDAPGQCARHPQFPSGDEFGVRRADGSWKPSALVPASQSRAVMPPASLGFFAGSLGE